MNKMSIGTLAATAILTLSVALPFPAMAAAESITTNTEEIVFSEMTDTNESYITEAFALLNEERTKAGLSALELDDTLNCASNIRVSELETVFSHKRSGGKHFSTILNESGISFQSASEIIAAGQDTVSQVMNDWMNSSSHRSHILNPSNNKVGISHHVSDNGTDYWVMIFISQ